MCITINIEFEVKISRLFRPVKFLTRKLSMKLEFGYSKEKC